MIFAGAAIASVLLLGQSGAIQTRPPEIPRPLTPAERGEVERPRPPVGPDRSRAVQPRGNPGQWVTTEDYPSRALRDGREGVVSVQLGVGPDGRVFTCGIRLTSASDDLDLAACRNIFRRARFEPALDSNGVPQIATWPIAVRWAIPTDEGLDSGGGLDTPPARATRATAKPWMSVDGVGPPVEPTPRPLPFPRVQLTGLARPEEFRPPASPGGQASPLAARRWVMRIEVGTDGRVTGCTQSMPSEDLAFDQLLCARYRQQMRFVPAHDGNGRGLPSWLYAHWAMPAVANPGNVP